MHVEKNLKLIDTINAIDHEDIMISDILVLSSRTGWLRKDFDYNFFFFCIRVYPQQKASRKCRIQDSKLMKKLPIGLC